MQQVRRNVVDVASQREAVADHGGQVVDIRGAERYGAQVARLDPSVRQKREIEQAASYVADLSADLAKIARNHTLGMLADILDLAHLEARRSMKVVKR